MRINQGVVMQPLIHSLFALAVLAGALSAQAQVRTWAFSKDTVHERTSVSDSVTIANNGTDTLRFDSIGMELVRPTANQFQVMFNFQNQTYLLNQNQQNLKYHSPMTPIKIAAGQTANGFDFRVEDYVVRTAKSSAIVQGDTLLVRMIFLASANRGRDTLMLKGKQDLPATLRVPRKGVKSASTENSLFDLRGRRVESIPEGLKAFLRASLAPRD
jgi:hypothetical protein